EGGSVSYTAKADNTFVIDTLTVNGQAVAEAEGKTEYTGTVTDIKADVEISVTFRAESTQPDPEDPDPTPGEDSDKPGTGGQDKPGADTDKPGAGTDKPDKGSSADKAVQTGDSSSPILWAAVLAAACAAGAAAVRTRTKKTK